jgi:hypothetical protein
MECMSLCKPLFGKIIRAVIVTDKTSKTCTHGYN